jgi:2-polyprenyl-3-methyl-5-hydroxy-6-metoxy-1,4-benzoquinol methylase
MSPAVEDASCPLCGGKTTTLPAPNPARSAVSDGRLIGRALVRLSCLECGAASHMSNISGYDIKAIYADHYGLPSAAPAADAARARLYAGWIAEQLSPPRSILEIGCGSGAMLHELARSWPTAVCIGIDPALPVVVRSNDEVRLERGFLNDTSAVTGNFDLIVAINVIEHTSSPAAFLTALEARLAPKGQIAIVCPTAEPPNMELLFYDHIFSLTPNSLLRAASSTSLVARKVARAPAALGDFQMMILNVGPPPSSFPVAKNSFSDLSLTREAYLEHWINLDAALLTRLDCAERLIAFGGGQMACLLRAYAPKTWSQIEMIVLDDSREAWDLDKPVESYAEAAPRLGAAAVLIAAAPRVQNKIAERLRHDGLRPIRYDDLIAR